MPVGSIAILIVAYVAIAILLLSLNLTSRWRWWIKGGAIVITSAFFVVSYVSIVNLLGWPRYDNPPSRFQLFSTHIVEPDKFNDAPGSVYLWVANLDEDNVPDNTPRAYRIAFTSELAEEVRRQQERLDAGEEVTGEIQEAEGGDGGQQQQADQNPDSDADVGNPTDAGAAAFVTDDFTLSFSDSAPIRLPGKDEQL